MILIIDNNAANLLLYRYLLKVVKKESLKLVCFESPLDALEWCFENEPDLVLLDYAMSSMNGLEFIEKFKSIFTSNTIPFVMVTAEGDVKDKALELGAFDFLNKPVNKSELILRVRNLLDLHESQKAIANRAEWLAMEVKKATEEIKEREKEMIIRLSKAAEHRDPETGYHLVRMANYSRLIARELGLSETEQNLILESAPMHDIGKVATPDAILLKAGKLISEEFTVMKDHAQKGYDILSGSNSLLISTAATMALTHHEKFDGSGYPNGLKGEEIPLCGRIIAVGDVFDALTSCRPYKKAWTVEEAANFLKENSGSHFDPRCVQALLRAWGDVLDIYTRYKDNF